MEALGVFLILVICGPMIILAVGSLAMCGRQITHVKEKKRLMRLMEEHPEHAGEILRTIREEKARYRDDVDKWRQAVGHMADGYENAGKKFSEAGSTMRSVGGKMAGGVFKVALRAARKR